MSVPRSGWVTLVAVLYWIAGVFNLLIGLVALGVSLSGSASVESVHLGDWPREDFEEAGVIVTVIAVLQIVLGVGIMRRERWAWFAGLMIASLAVVLHLFFIRLLDGWVGGGLITSGAILLILALKQKEFV